MARSGREPIFGKPAAFLLTGQHAQAPAVLDHSRTLPQGDGRAGPARHGCPVGRFAYLEVVHASDLLDNAVACVVPDVHAEGKTFAQDAQLKSITACRTIARRLNLEEEIHHTASKLCILRFEPRK